VAVKGGGGLMTLALGMVLGLIGYGLAALTVSGVLAALVGIEEASRARSERE
jgi:hypothetical protein